MDDAPGEAFDKVARALGMGYPGGPAIAAAAEGGDPAAYALPSPKAPGIYDVSFSGLKTAVLNIVNAANMKNEPLDLPGLAASFQNKVADVLTERMALALQNTGLKTLCLAGGVAANELLRQKAGEAAANCGARFVAADRRLCGDNAEMVAAQGYYEWLAGHVAGDDLNAAATMPVEEAM